MIDPATFVCCEDFRWNSFFRTTSHTNSIVVNGQNQKRRAVSANWLKPNPSNISRWLSEDTFELVQGYQTDERGLKQHRLLFGVKHNYWLVLDQLDPSIFDQSTNLYTQYWYLTPGSVGVDQNGWLHLERDNQKFAIANQVWSDIQPLVINTKINEGTGELSAPTPTPDYHRAPVISQSFKEAGSLLAVSVLQMENPDSSELLSITRLPAQDGAYVICLQFADYTDYFYYNSQPEGESKVRFGDFTYQGDFCHVRLNQQGKAIEVRVAQHPQLTSPPLLSLNLFTNNPQYLFS